MSNWIPVSERLPEKERFHVIVASDYFTEGSGIGVLHNGEFWTHNLSTCLSDATHWMSISKPPAQDGEVIRL